MVLNERFVKIIDLFENKKKLDTSSSVTKQDIIYQVLPGMLTAIHVTVESFGRLKIS